VLRSSASGIRAGATQIPLLFGASFGGEDVVFLMKKHVQMRKSSKKKEKLIIIKLIIEEESPSSLQKSINIYK